MSKGSKPKKAKVQKASNTYGSDKKPLKEATFSGPFGSGTSKKEGQAINTTATLSPELQQASTTAQTGLNNNLGYLQRDPNQRIDYLRGGNDPLYNVLQEQAQRQYDQNLGRARLNAQDTGSGNSTAAGAAYAQLMRDKTLQDNQILLQALDYGSQSARADAGVNLGAVGGLAQLVYPLSSAANAQLNTGMQSINGTSQANAAAQNAANMQYAQDLNAYRQRQGAGMGSGIGSLAGTLGGAAIGSIIPGAGTMLGAQLGAALGGGIGGMFNKPTPIQGDGTNYWYSGNQGLGQMVPGLDPGSIAMATL